MTDDTPLQPETWEELASGVRVRRNDLSYAFTRSSGPGGQAVNKLNTAVQLRVQIDAIEGLSDAAIARLRRLAGQRLTQSDEVLIQSQEHRSQLANRRACLERLRELVGRATTIPKRRKKKKPTRAMIQKRLNEKKQQGEKKARRQWRSGDA